MVLDLAAKTKATAAARASSSADDDQDLDGFKIADPTNNSEKKKMRLSKEANIMLAGIVNSKISKKPAADIKRAACSRKVPPEKNSGWPANQTDYEDASECPVNDTEEASGSVSEEEI